jgi:hypothetical protein
MTVAMSTKEGKGEEEPDMQNRQEVCLIAGRVAEKCIIEDDGK